MDMKSSQKVVRRGSPFGDIPGLKKALRTAIPGGCIALTYYSMACIEFSHLFVNACCSSVLGNSFISA